MRHLHPIGTVKCLVLGRTLGASVTLSMGFELVIDRGQR